MKAIYIQTAKKVIEQSGSCEGVDCHDCPLYHSTEECLGDHVPSEFISNSMKRYLEEHNA